MRSIVDGDLGGSLDLVLDDASHRYAAMKASFETIFPRLRPGGPHIVEDLARGHWRASQSPDHALAKEQSLTDLVRELTEVIGSTVDVISDLTIYHGFAVVQRGDASLRPTSASNGTSRGGPPPDRGLVAEESDC